jgi:hypothetical protein
VAGEPHPAGFVVGLGMKFQLAARAVNATEDSEEVERNQFDSFETAFVYSCHINSTQIFESSRLQNVDGFVVTTSLSRTSNHRAAEAAESEKLTERQASLGFIWLEKRPLRRR